MQDLTPVKNEVGRIIGEPLPDPWEGRLGVTRGLEYISPHISVEDALLVLQFMVPQGLGDRHVDVRVGMLAAALAVLNAHEHALSSKLMTSCEEYLSTASDTLQTDLVRQSIVVLMGTLAKGLNKDDPRVSVWACSPIICVILEGAPCFEYTYTYVCTCMYLYVCTSVELHQR